MTTTLNTTYTRDAEKCEHLKNKELGTPCDECRIYLEATGPSSEGYVQECGEDNATYVYCEKSEPTSWGGLGDGYLRKI